jgi:hypothetical protein
VLRGRPTLRTRRRLARARGRGGGALPAGARRRPGLANETDERVRVLDGIDAPTPEVVEYPDLNQVTAQERNGLADRRSALVDPRCE